jgi:hypothetical protein
MENATITFNTETAGQGVIHFSLNAHELAHQWFGDHVTMDTIDDLWTKEGTATFLAAEAELAFRDGERRGRMFGADFLFLNSTAVIDPELSPYLIHRPAYQLFRAIRKPAGRSSAGFVLNFSIDTCSSGVTRSSASIQNIQLPVVIESANSCLSL